MRNDLLGLPLGHALAVLASRGVEPLVTRTSAPRRKDETRGMERVVYASDDGRQLTVSRFLDPIEDWKKENG